MNLDSLTSSIKKKRSFLCVGLDPDLDKIPIDLGNIKDTVVEFCKQIIDATQSYCVSYKLNIAFFESLGIDGWKAIIEILSYIPDEILVIADAKRGDIGNSSKKYAETFFEKFDFDALTVAPYMGLDSLQPFLDYSNKWTIVLALTSNPGSHDFQLIEDINGTALYQHILEKFGNYAGPDQLMFVVGATQPDHLIKIRAIIPDHFLLVPGVGAQGGSLSMVSELAMNESIGLLVNSSRGIIYAGQDSNFAKASKEKAQIMQKEMSDILTTRGW